MYSFPNFEPVHCSMSNSNCCSCPAYRFLRRQVRWSGIPISLRIFHSLLWSIQSKTLVVVKEAEVDVFLKFPCFFYDPTEVGNLISGSSAFSKSSLCICKLSIHVLLKASLKHFEYYLASLWNEWNCMVVQYSFALHFFGIQVETDFFQSCGHCWVFQIYWHIDFSTLTASSFRILSCSIGIPSLPLTLFILMFPKDHLTSHCKMSGSRWVIIPSWLSQSLRPFCIVIRCILATYS